MTGASTPRQSVKAADYMVDFLAAQGVKHVFELVGGMTTHLVDALYRRGEPKIISVRHEQAAAFAADAAGRLTGVPGVAMATSGPGATNLITGIGSAYFDSSPTVFITGQVNRHEQRGDRAIRQLGFQETDIVSMVRPVTKAAWLVDSPESLPGMLADAFALALSGRPGPVLLDVPMDVQNAQISVDPPRPISSPSDPTKGVSAELLEQLMDDLQAAERPLVLAGGGVRAAGVRSQFRVLAEKLGAPVVNSLLGVDALEHSDPLRVGLIGSYGNRWANTAIGECDFMLVVGSRLDIRQTGADVDAFKGERRIYHVDCEEDEINNRVTGCIPVLTHLAGFVAAALEAAEDRSFPARDEWFSHIREMRERWPDVAELADSPGINPNELIHRLSRASSSASAFVADVGQHQQWAAQSVELSPDQRFVTSGGMGALGFGLPAAVGAAMASPGKPVVLVAGDGGFQLNIQELQTVVHNAAPIKIVILNNLCHGMNRQFQETYFEGRYPATYWGYSAPDFATVAHSYGIEASTVEDPAEVDGALEALWREADRPYLLQVMIDPFANAYPKIAFGRPITEMEPTATPVSMEAT